MMHALKKIFHFLGGIYLAIFLIATAALMVIAGTLIESKTDSHLLAAEWTYAHPLFVALLCLFFVNILFSALRRWPFQKKHIPFLITHLGLLMIITGTLIKNRRGLQGNLVVWEGSGSQHVLLPHTHALYVEKKGQKEPFMIALPTLERSLYTSTEPQLSDVKFKVVGHAPHVNERFETWIKRGKAYLMGLPLIDVQAWEPGQALPPAVLVRLDKSSPSPSWQLLAIKTTDQKRAFTACYLDHLILRLTPKLGLNGDALEIPVQQALEQPFDFLGATWQLALSTLFEDQAEVSALTLTRLSGSKQKPITLTLPLQGERALYLETPSSEWMEPTFQIDLTRPFSRLCVVEDSQGEPHFFAFDAHGRFWQEKSSPTELSSLLAYDRGFAGYAVQVTLPFPTFATGRQDKELADAHALSQQLREVMDQNPPLSPPLKLLAKACQSVQQDTAEAFVQFLVSWKQSPAVLRPTEVPLPADLQPILQNFPWETLSEQEWQGCLWAAHLLDQLTLSLQEGEDLVEVMHKHRWPFIPELQQALESSGGASALNVLAQQIFSISSHLPPLPIPGRSSNLKPEDSAHLLSAYFRVYEIDPQLLVPPLSGKTQETFERLEAYRQWQGLQIDKSQALTLETRLTSHILPEKELPKREERRPGIVLEVERGAQKEKVVLAYDAAARGLKWPVLDGEYLVRFQPMRQEIPYRIRLREARQLFYPQSTQVYSYESDVVISGHNQPPLETTLSMNRVLETWDGHRFYLSSISSAPDQGLKSIQLVVNHDPAKYFLTYPGAFCVFLGVIWLFWGRNARFKTRK